MKVYEFDDGAIYFVAATSLREAVTLYWKTLDDCGAEYPDDHLDINEVLESRARHILINVEGVDPDHRQVDAWTLAQDEGPGVLGSSEWP